MTPPKIRFAVTGLNHGHIYDQTKSMLNAGAEAVCFYAPEDDLSAQYRAAFPYIPRVETLAEILKDDSIQLVLNAGIPVERAPLGIQVIRTRTIPVFELFQEFAIRKEYQNASSRFW